MVRKQRINRKKMAEENVLKVFFQLAEVGYENVTYSDFLNKRQMDSKELTNTIAALIKKGFIKKHSQFYRLSENGAVEAARIVRFHRLWELYLTNRLNFKEDHIHGTAETIEHLITPEIEKELLKELQFPTADPHNKNIPY
jgi:manganese/zinc/iron transport system permease protein